MDGKPDFMGHWTTQKGYTGIFFITLQQQKGNDIEGVMEDILGKARISGKITPVTADFNKRYLLENGIPSYNVIHYHGVKIDNTFYEGTYKFPREENYTGRFILQSCPPVSKTVTLVLEELRRLYLEENGQLSDVN